MCINFSYKLDDDWYSRWLCTPREDGKPRVLILEAFAERSIFAFIQHIKKVYWERMANGEDKITIIFSVDLCTYIIQINYQSIRLC
jgi:hypothetical protein